LLIPFFLLCNYHPEGIKRELPVVFESDAIFWSVGVFMSFSSGYLSSLAMMYAPQSQTNPQYQVKAGMFAAAMLITGIVAGIFFSSVLPSAVQYNIPFLNNIWKPRD
jgi:solute carrier family 29 (equilibrative nucleoside transporter), member 1/2/3